MEVYGAVGEEDRIGGRRRLRNAQRPQEDGNDVTNAYPQGHRSPSVRGHPGRGGGPDGGRGGRRPRLRRSRRDGGPRRRRAGAGKGKGVSVPVCAVPILGQYRRKKHTRARTEPESWLIPGEGGAMEPVRGRIWEKDGQQ
ncbi:MAG: hypothetical protein Kow0092_30290 [Deferrisomatales bacterium]